MPGDLGICDDCSIDDTVAIAESFAPHPGFPVRVVRNETNPTTTTNFEKAIGLCTGDIILLLDQDDVWMPERLAEVGNHFETNREVGALFCNRQVCDALLEPLGDDMWEAQWCHPAEQRKVRAGRATEVFASG